MSIVVIPASISEAAGNCATYQSFITGDSFGPSQINGIQVLLGQTNMVFSCLDDYSATAAQMGESRNPYPSGAVSLATTGQEELTGLRHAIEQLTGWGQWYQHTDDIRRASTWNAASTNFCAFCVAVTDTASHASSRFIDLIVVSGASDVSKFSVTKAGNVTAAGTLEVTGATTLSTPLGVASGGTGLASGTAFGIPYYSASTTLASSAALANGQLLIGSTGANPVVGALTAGTNITVTNGAGSITIAATGVTITRSTQDVATTETTTSTSFTDLATSGPAVTLTPGGTTDQVILVQARFLNNAAGARSHMSPAIAGATALEKNAVQLTNDSVDANTTLLASAHVLATSVANGSTHTSKYKVGSGTGTFEERRISAFTLN